MGTTGQASLDDAIKAALDNAAKISAKMIQFQTEMEPLKTSIGVAKQQFG
jgi:hypothetical protein